MAIAQYKVVKEFDDNKIGYVLVLDPSKAQDGVERGRLQLQKYLDPEDETDAATIEHFRDNPTGAKKRATKAPKKGHAEEAVAAPRKRAATKAAKPAKTTAPKKAAKKTTRK